MIIVLLTIFAIAIVIIVAGLLLSPRPQVSDRREISYASRDRVRRAGETRQIYTAGRSRSYRVGENRHMSARRSPVELERRAWSKIVSSLNVGRVFGRATGEGYPWLGILLILFTLFIFGVYSLRTLLPNSPLLLAMPWVDNASAAPTTTTNSVSSASTSAMFSSLSGASKALKRIGQLDPNQYKSAQEYNLWAYSTCSAAAMTEVINAYGHQYRLTDILSVEARLGEITPDQGLLEPTGIDHTVAQFGFKAAHLQHPALQDVINVANKGWPVLVSFPPSRWAGGHILVVIGGTANYVYLADSSRLNMQAMTHTNFMKYWVDFAVVVTPK